MTAGSFQCCPLTGLETAGTKPLNVRKYCFTGIVCPEVVESRSLEIFKCHLDMVLDNWPSLEQAGWTRWHLEIPSNLNHSLIVWPWQIHKVCVQYRRIYNTETKQSFLLFDVLSCTCLFRTLFVLVTDQTTALTLSKENLKSQCHALVSHLSLNQKILKKELLCK